MLLTNPIWLLALAAIGIPVIIHLWNIKPGKTLKVGSISLFSESSPSSSRSFKLLDILLLLLRCLLLALPAILLTAPIWRQQLNANNSKGWILIPQTDFKEAYHKFQPKIDSLTKVGYEFHFFQSNFSKQDLGELISGKMTDSSLKKDSLNYWSLINQLSNKLSPATSVALFTPNTITHFTGKKPVTHLRINWHTYMSADSVSTWLSGAWLTANGNIRIMHGTSTPSDITYQYNDVKNGGQTGSPYGVSIDDGLPVITFKDSKIPVDTTVIRIAIYKDNTDTDANYLKAALEAITKLTGRNTIIKLYSQANAIPANQDWIYWLSDKPASNVILAKTKNLLSYETGKIAEVSSWISDSQNNTISQNLAKIALYKTIVASNLTGNMVWADGFGNPVLSTQQNGNSTHYYFYSRFSPSWNDLVWSNEFPKWLLTLTHPAVNNVLVHDNRIISNTQLQPGFIANTEKPTQLNIYTDLTHYLWLALALIFFAERWLATKNKTVLANG